MKIIVLAGGYSPERDVSLTSGSLIANALMENGHSVLLLDVYEGLPALPDTPASLFRTSGKYAYSVKETVPDLDALKRKCDNGDALIGKHVLELCRMADIVFLALHGGIGENGQLQATLDNYGIRYTGSGYIGSLLAMDKDLSKRLLREAGINTPDWMYFRIGTDSEDALLSSIGLPCVVKPCSCGSSVGVSMVETREELTRALADAAKWDTHVLVEKRIVGRELTVGILDGKTLPAVEIIPDEGFYDYRNKYQGKTREVCPAEIPDAAAKSASEMTLRGFAALRLRGYARFDYLLDEAGELWCLEANTLPGMTPTSLLPQAAAVAGMDYNALCEKIIEIAR
ncbi:MAG: D-alanine--D-alanine ligase [Clostridia bacterium]|nr:D-alanine--D-alanine ligase [Clostridia bacterium]MBQ9774375.1 D-alanine--D-alanine ligase [Clostridia bacterium]